MKMKRTLLLLSVLLAVCCPAYSGQERVAEVERLLKEDLSRAGGNTNSYEFRIVRDTPAPAGYKAFYISHYGRHGSRSAWNRGEYDTVVSILTRARSAGILNAEGLDVCVEAENILKAHNGMNGRLTPKGVREHEMLAQRMYRRFPGVLKGKKAVRVISSTVPRCLVSMSGFTNALSALNPALDFSFDAGETYQTYINETGSKEPRKKIIEPMLDSLAGTMPYDTSCLVRRLFTDGKAAENLIRDVHKFNTTLYNMASISEDFEIDDCILEKFPFDFIYRSWSVFNHSLYMYNCNSVEIGKERLPWAEKLVTDFVTKADEVIAGGNYAADLRFGHDFPLLGLVSHLGLEGVGDRLSFNEVDGKWWGFFQIPMASNLQMIFYRNKAGKVLVKFLYNEQETLLRGMEPECGPYYSWDKVKSDIAGYLR